MDELTKILIEFLRQKRRWPLLLIFVVPAWFAFALQFDGTTFREAFSDWIFLLGFGVLTLSAGVLYVTVVPRRAERWLVGVPLVLVGISALLAGRWEFEPRELPKNKLVVLVAKFTPASPGAEEEADNLSSRIEEMLLEKQRMGAPLEVKRTRKSVDGTDEQERGEAAVSLGTSHALSANVVIWGEVRKDGRQAYIKPRIAAAQPLKLPPANDATQLLLMTEPLPDLQLRESRADDLADLVTLSYAIAYFGVRDCNTALTILPYVKAREAHLFEGLCRFDQAQQSAQAAAGADAALSEFDKILGPDFREPNASTDETIWWAYLDKTMVTVWLAIHGDPRESLPRLHKSERAYSLALQLDPQRNKPAFAALTHSNLAVVLRNESSHVREQSNERLKAAKENYEQALWLLSPIKDEEFWAATEYNLGITLQAMSLKLSDSESKNLLQEAFDANQKALRVFTKETFPWLWANVLVSEGDMLKDLAALSDSTEGVVILRQAIQAFQNSLEVFSRPRHPQDWAMTQSNLCAVSTDLAKRLLPKDGVSLLNQAITQCDAALEVRTRNAFPQDWAVTQTNLGVAYENMGLLGGRGIGSLQNAVAAYRSALEVQTKATNAADWANTQINLGRAWRLIGNQTRADESFRKSVQAWRSAEEVFTRRDYPVKWASLEHDVAAALCDWGSLKKGPNGDGLLREAIAVLDGAIDNQLRMQSPAIWSMLQNGLGVTYVALAERSKPPASIKCLRQAVEAYKRGLQAALSPTGHAAIQDNTAAALRLLSHRVPDADAITTLQDALALEKSALTVRTKNETPMDWANSETNLGIILSDLAERVRGAQGLGMCDDANKAFEQVLSVYAEENSSADIFRVLSARLTTDVNCKVLQKQIPPASSPR